MSGQYCVDANVFVTAWSETYPEHIFPTLWKQIALRRGEIILIKPIYAEIDPVSHQDKDLEPSQKEAKYPLRMWLTKHGFRDTDIDFSVERQSLVWEREYEVRDRAKGANKNDMTLIAYAKITGKVVVTLERRQTQKPGKKCNYKIPLVCNERSVKCINFVEMLERLDIRA